MKRFLLVTLALVASAGSALPVDNVVDRDMFQLGAGNAQKPVVLRATDNGDGTYTLVVSGTFTPAPNVITTVTPSNVSVTTSSTSVLVANANRKDAVVTNYGATGCFLARGSTALSGQGIYLAPNGGAYNIDANNLYRGALSAITASGTATLSVSEGQ